ncbi:MAG: tRNA (cytidine(34)-2'-O)-methyltransferase [Deltaproteobacteria bacterium]|nr:tRNA (cytidine(34)-2'-O)-methyltransferase [Deltaproteobacteria bacterium]
MHVVLVNPLIPQNTGSIARLCAGTDTDLHLVGTLGFSLDDRHLKRAGLDYWPNVRLHLHPDFDDLQARHTPSSIALFSSHATRAYVRFEPTPDAFFVFGSETTGLPPELRQRFADHLFKIPITGHIRSLNLSNAVSIVLYDALRRFDFPGLG